MGVDPSVLVHVGRVLRGRIHPTGSKPFRGKEPVSCVCVFTCDCHCVSVTVSVCHRRLRQSESVTGGSKRWTFLRNDGLS